MPFSHETLPNLVDAFYTLYPENHTKKCYFFFDEIQNLENFAQVIRRLQDTKNSDIFLTGSSAKLLSKEIPTTLRGRSLTTEIWPFSFNEFLKAHLIKLDRKLFDSKTKDLLTKWFHTYLSQGGFPEITDFSVDVKQQTLQEYLDVAIYRDIIERHSIKYPNLIKLMILSMIHNVGKPFSINKFYNDLKSKGYQIGKETLYDYADHIEDAYLIFSVPLYNESIRKVHVNSKKIHPIDPGLVRALTLVLCKESFKHNF
jgi:predicted AAA+ superfamily ATPase